jgi:hypothetical protein
MDELTRNQIDCCRGLALRGGRVDDAEIAALCQMAARYLELRERIRVEAADAHKRGHLSLSAGLRVLLTPAAEEEPHHGE